MLIILLFILAVIFSIFHISYKKAWHIPLGAEIFLSYILLFCMGVMGLLAAYAHVFMGPETARMIGWQPGSPFQFEIGMANLSYGVLGVLAFWHWGRFWEAAIIGWAILLIGCFIGHLINYYATGNAAPWNIGLFIFINDLILPIFTLLLLGVVKYWKN